MWYVVDFGIVNEVMFTAFVSTNAQNFGGNNLHFNVIWRQDKKKIAVSNAINQKHH